MSLIQAIHTPHATPPVGPYSQAVRRGNLILSSGQIPLDTEGEFVGKGDIQAQTHQVFKNLEAVLEAAGCKLSDILKCTIFLIDMDQFAKFNEVYAEYFTENPPARSCVQVARLPKDVDVEIEAIAWKE